MHKLSRVVAPLILSVDGEPVTAAEVALIEAVRPELQRYWLAYGYALLIADTIVVPDREDIDPAAFHAPGAAFFAALAFCRSRYPALIGGEHIPLVFLKGVNRTELGSLGWGGLGFATVSWDTLIESQAQERAHWLAGIAAHELAHGLGYQHVQEPAPNILWAWWGWPSLYPPPVTAGVHPDMLIMRALSVSSEDVGTANDVCPMPPEGRRA